VIRSSLPPKVYAAADTFLLSAFATAWALHKRAAHEVAAPDFEGVVRSVRGGRQPNPWIRIMNQQAMMMAAIGDRLGLNPKARAALHVPEEKPPSKFDGLLGGEWRFDA
jgi:phage terminase small subunit